MPSRLGPALKKALGPEPPSDERPVVVLGVGSPLRSDDAAGLRVAAGVGRARLRGVVAIEAGPSPENVTAEIRRLRPSTVVVVDSAQAGEAPGSVRLFEPAQIAGVSFGTHGLPLSVLAEYLRRETGCSVVFLGIEPASLEHGQTLSPPVRAAVNRAVSDLCAALDPRSASP